MAKLGSKKDTAAYTDTLWCVLDKDTDELVKTDKGLLAVYVTRQDARDAVKSGRVRSQGTHVIPFCEYVGDED